MKFNKQTILTLVFGMAFSSLATAQKNISPFETKKFCISKGLHKFYHSVGAGTQAKPYEIYNESQFRHFASHGASQDLHFIQCRSINFNYSQSPNQNQFFIQNFRSFYNGNNHSLSNFKLSDGFGMIKTILGGEIKNLTLKNFQVEKLTNVTGSSNAIYMGILGARAENFFRVENITIQDSKLKSNKQFNFLSAGGLVGLVLGGVNVNKVNISNLRLEFNYGENCGGLIGYIGFQPAVIKNIHLTNKKDSINSFIRCRDKTGGLGGTLSKTKIENVLIESRIENGQLLAGGQPYFFGGVVAKLEESQLLKAESRSVISVNVATLEKSMVIGGLTGLMDSSSISYSQNKSQINLLNRNANTCNAETGIGGITGVLKNNSSIEWARSEDARITVHNFFGGIGGVAGKLVGNAQIRNTYGLTHFKLSGDLAVDSPYLGGFVGFINNPTGASIMNSYSDFTYEQDPSSKIKFSGGFVGIVNCTKKMKNTLFDKTIASMNVLNGGLIPKPFESSFPNDEGKFVGYIHPTCEFDFSTALSEQGINFLESMSCNNENDTNCSLGVKHFADSLFNFQTGPVQTWTLGPNKWVAGEQGGLPTIPKAGSIIPQLVN